MSFSIHRFPKELHDLEGAYILMKRYNVGNIAEVKQKLLDKVKDHLDKEEKEMAGREMENRFKSRSSVFKDAKIEVPEGLKEKIEDEAVLSIRKDKELFYDNYLRQLKKRS